MSFYELNKIFLGVRGLTIKDVFDISFLTFILFFVLYVLWESRFSRIFRGIIVILIIFVVSKLFGLTLTNIFFQSFLSIFLIILILIFQSEIRKTLEKFGLFISYPKKLTTSKKELIIENIVDALKFFSENKIGALLVFERKDVLSPYLQNEIYLNSEINFPVLATIFHKGSALHDGAVIIDENKIKYAGAHLPLGTENYNLKKRGTRHRAGTAITAETDAFSIIVSEETGEISLAENGVLKTNIDINEIIKILNDYYFPPLNGNKEFLFSLTKINLQSLIKYLAIFFLSFSIVFSVWLFTNYDKTKIQKIVEVPIEFKNLNDNLSIEKPSVSSVKLTLSAIDTDFKFLNTNQIKLLIDLKDFEEGYYNLSLIKESVTNIPKTIQILNIEPKIIKFKLIPKSE